MKKEFRSLALIVAAMFCLTATADEAEVPAVIDKHVSLQGDAAKAISELAGAPVRFVVRRYASSNASEAAYGRLEKVLTDLARSREIVLADDGDTEALTVEVDSTFYVYTNRFNARLVRLGEYTEAQVAGQEGNVAAAPPRPVDALRIAAGALGIIRGWISPAFGSYMIAGGATPALFGAGSAPTRLFVAGRERYDRGEQEVNTRVRLLRSGTLVGSIGVRCWTAGDAPPFQIDALVADNWSTLMAVLMGRTEWATKGEAPQHPPPHGQP